MTTSLLSRTIRSFRHWFVLRQVPRRCPRMHLTTCPMFLGFARCVSVAHLVHFTVMSRHSRTRAASGTGHVVLARSSYILTDAGYHTGGARMTRRKHRLGRLASKDRDRDEEFLMRRRLGAAGKPLPTRKTWALRSAALNQGDTGTCVGHAWRNFLRCAPVMMEKTGPSAYDIYRTAVPLDDWK